MKTQAIFVQYYGLDKYADNNDIYDHKKTTIFLIDENEKVINLFDISEGDPQDHYFNRDFEGLNNLGNELFEIYKKYDLLGILNVDSHDILELSFEELKSELRKENV